MFPRVRAVALAAFGFILLAAAPGRLFLFPVESLLTGLGVVYFSIGALSGLSTVRSDRESLKFGPAVGVALLSIVAVLGWGVFVTGAFGRIDSSSLTWWVTTLGMTPSVTAPVVAALLWRWRATIMKAASSSCCH